jgi:7SK snRNA methylphosphate capping enzyme
LNHNGILILESQPFNGYKKRSKLSSEILQNYKSIVLKPEQFEAYLLSEEIGFADSWCMTDSEILKNSSLAKGFHRPLQIFTKR